MAAASACSPKYLKSDSCLPSKKETICFNENVKIMKSAYFTLKIFEFLSWLNGYAEKTPWLER